MEVVVKAERRSWTTRPGLSSKQIGLRRQFNPRIFTPTTF